MIYAYIIFRAISYIAVGLIALNRRWYSLVFLMACFLLSTITPEILDYSWIDELLNFVFPMGVIWLGWDLVHSHKKP